ncbi:MAG TPA: response regulator [Urbifossiella sp.]|nr:response regulator [Urbifossiella sp.]
MTNRLKVLVVDDNPDAAQSAADLLALAGCDTRACSSGASALREAAEFDPDVAVLDLSMPGMGGVELGTRLQEQAAHPVRLVAHTGRWDINASHQTHNAGFERHLVKPADPHTLIAAVTGRDLACA